ncbi:MAG: DeoR/GlpR family DNA-binding transcription regulator [Oscillospiraceae bacterium]|nr:DeoR/GlpR family DNA-binding transcription regulator [Oscillospiraceae bacterium]
MLAIERRNAILAKLSLEGKVIVSELSLEFDVTEETIRRDLEKLDKEGLAQKTYGGAVLNHGLNTDLPYNVRKRSNVEQKEIIAEKISQMIHDGDYIMLDSSSTAIYITKYIKNLKNITLITNSVETLIELADKENWNVLSTGGALKKGSLSLVGTTAERMIRSFHVDLAVCSSKGLDLGMGITDSNEKDSEIKRAIFSSATRKILAVDSSKFDKISFVRVGDITDVDAIVTDSAPSERWIDYLKDKNVELIY